MTCDIIIPVFNQLAYTRQCLADLFATVPSETRIIVVNNGSSDGTFEFLHGIERLTVIDNETNRGVAAAWNQGVQAGSSEWAVILNNDVLLPAGWLAGLQAFANASGADIVSPALREGERNYDVEQYAAALTVRMGSVSRAGEAHGVYFMVRRTVFDSIGFFDENFSIGGMEETDFFRRARVAGFRLAITGSSFIHHFGMVTQNYVKTEVLGRCYGPEHRDYFRRKWRLSWFDRLIARRKGKLVNLWHRTGERLRYGHTLHEKWLNGRLRYF